jgi:hypothetical protein
MQYRTILRLLFVCLSVALGGCATAATAPSTAVTAGPPAPVTASMGFPAPGTRWITRSTDETGWSWLTTNACHRSEVSLPPHVVL